MKNNGIYNENILKMGNADSCMEDMQMTKQVEDNLKTLKELCLEWEEYENAGRLMSRFEHCLDDVRGAISDARTGKNNSIDNRPAELFVSKLLHLSRKALETKKVLDEFSSNNLDPKNYFLSKEEIDYLVRNIQTKGHLFETDLDTGRPDQNNEKDNAINIKEHDINLVESILNKKTEIENERYYGMEDGENAIAKKINGLFPFIKMVNHKVEKQGMAFSGEDILYGVVRTVESGYAESIEDAYNNLVAFVEEENKKTVERVMKETQEALNMY